MRTHWPGRQAQSCMGFGSFDPGIKICGIIFNRVAGEGHYRILADAVIGTPVLGWLPFDASIEIPERHLGLYTAKRSAEPLPALPPSVSFSRSTSTSTGCSTYYSPEPCPLPSLNNAPALWKRVGAWRTTRRSRSTTTPIDSSWSERAPGSLNSHRLGMRMWPEADFLYIGGGYPELYRNELEANVSMRKSVRRFIESGKRFLRGMRRPDCIWRNPSMARTWQGFFQRRSK